MALTIRWRCSDQCFGLRGDTGIGVNVTIRKQSGKMIPPSQSIHNSPQFWDTIEILPTLPTMISVFELRLPLVDPAFEERPASGQNQEGRDSVNVGSLPQENLSISMLNLRSRSIITSGWKVSSDCQCQHDEIIQPVIRRPLTVPLPSLTTSSKSSSWRSTMSHSVIFCIFYVRIRGIKYISATKMKCKGCSGYLVDIA